MRTITRTRPVGRARGSQGGGIWVPLLVAALIIGPVGGHAEEILNSLTKYPPYNYANSGWLGFAPPPGYGYGNYVAQTFPQDGRAWVYGEYHHTSDCWPTPLPHNAVVYAALGSTDFLCTRTGSFSMDANVTMTGVAGIHVPEPPWWLGGSQAAVSIIIRLRVTDISIPLFPVDAKVQDFPFFYRFSQHTWEELTAWAEETLTRTMPGVPLTAGISYRVSAEVRADLHVQTTGCTAGGYSMACFVPRSGTFGPFGYSVPGYVSVNWVRLSDENPDLDPPTTVIAFCVPPPCTTLCYGGPPVTLSASDAPGGLGMGKTYWQLGSGTVNVGPGPIFFYQPDTLTYWSVDRAGNEEVHNKRFIDVIMPLAPPVHIAVPDDAGGLYQPVPLEWSSVTDADQYRLQVDDDPAFGAPEVDSVTALTSLDVGGLSTSTTFYWRVASHRSACNLWGAWSTPWSFTTDIQTGIGSDRGPPRFELAQNYPNPFSPKTTIGFYLPHPENVTISIFAVDGRRVATIMSERTGTGYHEVFWNGKDSTGRPVASGVYFYRIEAGPFVDMRKMILVR